jgi:hypothetical protein
MELLIAFRCTLYNDNKAFYSILLNQVKGFEQSKWSKQCKHAHHLKNVGNK